MKLAALYTVFNGLELLDGSIEQIYEEVDVIVICNQKTSNLGLKCDQSELPGIIKKYSKKINYLEYQPNLKLNTKENERCKHNLMLSRAKKLNCTHYLMLACDHYYKSDEFKKAKKICDANKWDVSLTQMNTYYKKLTLQVWPRENYYMPFISRLHPQTEFIFHKKYPVTVDPSIIVNTCEEMAIFEPEEILMHHYTGIRIDIEEKFKNAAASIRWSPEQIEQFKKEYKTAKPGKKLKYFQNRKLKNCENIFNI